MALRDYAAPLPETLLSDIHRAFDRSLSLAREKLDYRDAAPALQLSLRSARMAGRAMPQQNVIELNKVIFRNNPQWSFVYDTVAHEMAHIVACRKFGARAHDARWKVVAEALGATPQASGQFDTTGAEVRKTRPRKTYPFRCACQGFDFGAQRLGSYLKGSRYQCRRCKTDIHPDLGHRDAFENFGNFIQRSKLALLPWR